MDKCAWSVKGKENKGLILLGNEYQALGLLRQSKPCGIECVLVDQDKYGPALLSRYKNKFFQSPPYSSPEFWPWLKDLAIRKGYVGWGVITTDDEQVRQLAENYTEVVTLLKYLGLDWEQYKYIYDKRNAYEWSRKIGVDSPDSFIPLSKEDLGGIHLKYPFIVKPAYKREFKKYSNKKAIVVNSEGELISVLHKKLANVPVEELIFQEIIPGGGTQQWSYAGFFINGTPVAAYTARRRRQHPPDFGRASTYVESIYNEKVENQSLKILSELNYSGLAEVEWKIDPRDNHLKFFEVNARSWGWHSLSSHVVGNIALMYYDYIMNDRYERIAPTYGANWIKWITDLPVVLDLMHRKELDLSEYLRSVRRVTSCGDWESSDPIPFLFQVFILPYLIIKRGY
jgi:D-aspartate ligase